MSSWIAKIDFQLVFDDPLCYRVLGPTAAMIPVFATGRPIITKWGDYSTFYIPKVAEYLSEQL